MSDMGSLALDILVAGVGFVVVVQTAALLDVLRRAVRLKAEVYDAMPELAKQDRLAGGTFVDFEARDVESGVIVRSPDLRGAPAALLFIRAEERSRSRADWLLATASGLRHKGEGRVFVLCDGSAGDCAELSRELGSEGPVLLDEGGRIAERFLVRASAFGVLLDADARVAAYGMPESVPDREDEREEVVV